MGTSRNYDYKNKKITKFEYNTIGNIDGYLVIKSSDVRGNGAPKFSNSSKIYIIYAPDKKRITYVAFYDKNNQFYKRMDWEHSHYEFPKGKPHIQYLNNNITREPNPEELEIFKKIKEQNFYENYESWFT